MTSLPAAARIRSAATNGAATKFDPGGHGAPAARPEDRPHLPSGVAEVAHDILADEPVGAGHGDTAAHGSRNALPSRGLAVRLARVKEARGPFSAFAGRARTRDVVVHVPSFLPRSYDCGRPRDARRARLGSSGSRGSRSCSTTRSSSGSRERGRGRSSCIFLPISVGFVWAGLGRGMVARRVRLLFGGGVMLWTLIEYLMHRFVFHLTPRGRFGVLFAYLIHGVHARSPRIGAAGSCRPSSPSRSRPCFSSVLRLLIGAASAPVFAGAISRLSGLRSAPLRQSRRRAPGPRGTLPSSVSLDASLSPTGDTLRRLQPALGPGIRHASMTGPSPLARHA